LVAVLLTAAFSLAFSLQVGHAGSLGVRPVPDKAEFGSQGERLNANTLAIVSGNPGTAALAMGCDLSAVLDDGDNFRILPVIGKGGGQNVRDVRFLKGVDLGIVEVNTLNAIRNSNEIGSVDDKIVYVARLFNEEMHVVVRADSGITAIEQLSGKKINVGEVGSGSQIASRVVLQRLGIKAQETNLGEVDALERLRAGDIAAAILISGKPAAALARLTAADGYRFVPVPFAPVLQKDYLPAVLSGADYPGMVEAGHDIGTIAVAAVLIAYNWPHDSDRYRRIAKFVDVFFPRLAEFQKPPWHPKWRETNLAAVLPGWERIAAAEEWLQKNPQPPPAAARAHELIDQIQASRGGAGAGVGNADDRARLFQDFLNWQSRDHR